MSKGKLRCAVGFHTATACFCDGIGDYLSNLAAGGHTITAKCVDGTASLSDFQKEIMNGAEGYGIYRCLKGHDIPNYGAPVEDEAQRYMDKINLYYPPELDKNLFYIEMINECDKNQADWLGYFMVALGRKMMEQGYRFCAPGWSPGEPEPVHNRMPGMLEWFRLIEQYPNELAHAVHEYAHDDEQGTRTMEETRTFLMGRVLDVNAACQENGIIPPPIFVTEFGWNYRTAPNWQNGVPQVLGQLEWYIENAPNVKAVHLWALDKSSQWADISKTINLYMTPLANNINAIDWQQPEAPPPVDPPIDPPVEPPIDPPTGENILFNPSFEKGWTDHALHPQRIQVPKSWNVIVKHPGSATSAINQKTGEPSTITGVVEATHKSIEFLPPDEWPDGSNPLIADGEWSYKIQGVNMVAETELLQTIQNLTPDTSFTFKMKGKVHYHPNAGSIGEPDDIEVWVIAGDTISKYFVDDFPDRNAEWTEMEVTGKSDQWGTLSVKIIFMTKWQNSRDLFLDDGSLYAVGETPPVEPPTKPKVVILKLAQSHLESSWVAGAEYAYNNYKRTMTASHNDMMTMMLAGNSESYAIIVDPERPSQLQSIGLLDDAGLKYEVVYLEDSPDMPHQDLFVYRPCDTDRITQYFGANPNYYQQFGLPGHEGIDYGVSLGYPYYAVQDGRVVWASDKTGSGSNSNYGWHVYLEHEVDGLKFHTVYAHAQANLPVTVGQRVKAGDIVGHSGNTGVSSGPHIHFGLLWPTDTGNGYPMWRFGQCVDPLSYLEGKDAPPSEPDPPAGQQYDLVPYLCGDGRLYEVTNASGGTERFQTQGNHAEFWQTKNANAEQMFTIGDFLYRGWDTSPGGGRFYQQQKPQGDNKAPWMPRLMRVGDSYQVSLWVQFYDWGCNPSSANTGQVTDTRKFVKYWDTWTSRAGITLSDVIELLWTNGGERYFYAKSYGLVGWERQHQDPHTPAWSAISEIHAPGQRPPNEVNLPGCLS